MFRNIKKQLKLEIEHYLALSVDVRRLLISYYLYLMAYPLFMVFTNAYLWRQGGDLMQLVIYNLLLCFGLPLGFYVNGLLLALFYNLASVLVYMAVSTIGWAFRYPASNTILMEAMDQENSDTGQYAYVCDNELTYNIGRSLGLCLIMIALSISQTTALRFVPLIAGLISLSALFPLIQLSRRLFKKV